MAEYIDKDIAIQICMNSWGTDDASQDIKDEPPADVIEREKIDEALEITYKVRERVLHSNRTYEANDVLDIIDEISACFERHIGEDKEND